MLYLEPDLATLAVGTRAIGQSSVAPAVATEAVSRWDRLGAAVESLLGRCGVRGGIDVALSESLCHLALVKGNAGDLATDDALAVAAQYLKAQIPAAGAEAIVRVARVPAGDTRHLLGAALEQPLLDCLQQASRAARCRLRSLGPRVMRAFAALAGEATACSGHVVAADSRSAVIVSLRRGAWTQLRTHRLDAPDVAQWARSLEQAEALAGTGARDVWWCGTLPSGQLPGWNLRRLRVTDVEGLA